MTNLSVKDVPEDLAERLRQRAVRNHRSLQGELMAILEQAVRDADIAPTTRPVQGVAGAGWDGRPILRRGGKTTEQVAAEHRARFPRPVATGPSAVDIVRAERDAR